MIGSRALQWRNIPPRIAGSVAVYFTCAFLAVAAASAMPAPDTVLFQIDASQAIADGRFDPERHALSIRGALEPLSWSRGWPADDPDGDGHYEAQVVFPPLSPDEQPVAYKFKIENPAAPNDGWEDGANRYFVRVPGGQVVARAFGEAPPPLPPSIVGDVRELGRVSSKFVEPRDVFVYLPPGYDADTTRRYPVLYLHDGQNVFDARAVGAEWRIDETAERLIAAGEVEPFIVVGVANTPARIDEYTPTRSRIRNDLPEMGGRADPYARFLVEELKPTVDSTFRTLPTAEHTALGGSSLGGLVSLYAGLKYPDTFGSLLVVSPSIWWDDQFIVNHVRDLPGRTPQRIWLDIGTEEGDRFIVQTRTLRDALIQKGWHTDHDLHYLEAEGAQHTEAAWARRVEGMLRFLFARNPH